MGNLNWEIIKDGVAGILEVADTFIVDAVRHYFALANLKSEPTGALSLGSILADPEMFKGKKVCLVVSGGNVDPNVYAGIIQSEYSAN